MDDLYFDDWGVGSNLDASDVMLNANDIGVGAGGGSSWSFKDIISGVGQVAQEVAKYKRTTLPNGASIYQQIDPRTGLPIARNVALTTSSIQQYLPMLALGGLALLLVLKKR